MLKTTLKSGKNKYVPIGYEFLADEQVSLKNTSHCQLSASYTTAACPCCIFTLAVF